MNLKNWTAMAVLGVLSLAFAQREAKYSFSLTKDFSATVPISSRGGKFVLNASRVKKELVVQIENNTQRFALDTIDDSGSPAQGDILVEDFNFDGYNDVGVPIGIGYNGVNIFYEVHKYDPKQKKLVPIKRNGFEVSNPAFDTKNQVLITNSRSGPAWYGLDFKFDNGVPWKFRARNPQLLLGFGTDQSLVIQYLTFNKVGKVIASSLQDEAVDGGVVKRIVTQKMFLYTAPKESAITNSYIIRGDTVAILEILGEADVLSSRTEQWLKIAYQSQKFGRMIRWLHIKEKQ
jgi:hypothetical protein